MKTSSKFILGYMVAVCILLLSGCADDTMSDMENHLEPVSVPASVYEDFSNAFPDASDVEWSLEDGYAMASFRLGADKIVKETVWYDIKDCKLKMQSTHMDPNEIPDAVKTAFGSSEYSSWTLRGVEVLLRYVGQTVQTIYILRATSQGEATTLLQVKLFYTSEGVLVKECVEEIYDENHGDDNHGYGDWLPATPPDYVKVFVDAKYPDAMYLYLNIGAELTKVKILDGSKARMLLFAAVGDWICTSTQLQADELPAAVADGFRKTEFGDCTIEKIEERLTASEGDYYLLTVKDARGKKHELGLNADGSLRGEENGGSDEEGGAEPSEGYIAKTEIDSYLSTRYPGAVVIKKDYDDKGLEVKLMSDDIEIKVMFDLWPQGYEWTGSEWDLGIRNMPEKISDAITELYPAYEVYFLKFVETATDDSYYEAGLKSAQLKRSLKVKIDGQGNLLGEYGKN